MRFAANQFPTQNQVPHLAHYKKYQYILKMNSYESVRQIPINLFFLYFVLSSDTVASNILTCNMKRFLSKNIFLSHFLIWFSIFLFTFVLQWYTLENVMLIGQFDRSEPDEGFKGDSDDADDADDADDLDKDIHKDSHKDSHKANPPKINKYHYITQSVIYAFNVYILFILTTKQEHVFAAIFMVLLFLIFIVYIFYTIETQSNGIGYKELNKYFISKKDISEVKTKSPITEPGLIVALHNLLTLLYASSLGNMVVGFIIYLKRQMKEKGNKFRIMKFLFDKSKC